MCYKRTSDKYVKFSQQKKATALLEVVIKILFAFHTVQMKCNFQSQYGKWKQTCVSLGKSFQKNRVLSQFSG